jgi:hypothetical protein
LFFPRKGRAGRWIAGVVEVEGVGMNISVYWDIIGYEVKSLGEKGWVGM